MSDDVRSAAPVPTNEKKWKERNAVERVQLVCFFLLVAGLLYGVIRYPNGGPQLRDDGQYRDKARHVYSEAQFRSFKMWEHSYFGAGAVVLALTAVVEVTNRRRRT